MERYKTGTMAKSLSGHDSSKIYVIIESDDEYVYLTDGDIRKVDRPKKKKKKHIQVINLIDNELEKIIADGKSLTNEAVKYAIKKYKQRINKQEE